MLLERGNRFLYLPLFSFCAYGGICNSLHIISCLLFNGNEHDLSALQGTDSTLPSIYQVRKMENRARKAEMFTENSHLLLSYSIRFLRRRSYPFTIQPGNLEKWEGFLEKFIECLQIAIWCWWHENLPHLSTEKNLFWTKIWRNILHEIETFSVMPKSVWDILYDIPTIWLPAAPCLVQLFLWGKLPVGSAR